MNHAIHKPLFGKQESPESIQESRNQAKNLKIPESRQRKFRVADPSGGSHFTLHLMGKFYYRMEGNFGEASMICQTKLVLINNLLADL